MKILNSIPSLGLIYLCIWHTCQALHIVRFAQSHSNFVTYVQKVGKYPEEDPLNLGDLHSRQLICDKIIMSRQYFVLNRRKEIPTANVQENSFNPENMNIQRLGSTPDNPDPIDLWYRDHSVIVIWVKPKFSVRLLECVRSEKENWFIAFGQQQERMILYEPSVTRKTRRSLVTKGILEPGAKLDEKFLGSDGQIRLEHYFFNEIESNVDTDEEDDDEIPAKMSLCFLTFNDHGRLCSAVFDTLSQTDIAQFSMDVRHVNYIQIGEHRCLRKRVKLPLTGKMTVTNIASCSINRAYRLPQIFLLADLEMAGAVFVLVENILGDLYVVTWLNNLVVLLDQQETDER